MKNQTETHNMLNGVWLLRKIYCKKFKRKNGIQIPARKPCGAYAEARYYTLKYSTKTLWRKPTRWGY